MRAASFASCAFLLAEKREMFDVVMIVVMMVVHHGAGRGFDSVACLGALEHVSG